MNYLSKLLTMMGIGRDITRAPLIAQNVPTSFPNPVTGNISPYLSKLQIFNSFSTCCQGYNYLLRKY